MTTTPRSSCASHLSLSLGFCLLTCTGPEERDKDNWNDLPLSGPVLTAPSSRGRFNMGFRLSISAAAAEAAPTPKDEPVRRSEILLKFVYSMKRKHCVTRTHTHRPIWMWNNCWLDSYLDTLTISCSIHNVPALTNESVMKHHAEVTHTHTQPYESKMDSRQKDNDEIIGRMAVGVEFSGYTVHNGGGLVCECVCMPAG